MCTYFLPVFGSVCLRACCTVSSCRQALVGPCLLYYILLVFVLTAVRVVTRIFHRSCDWRWKEGGLYFDWDGGRGIFGSPFLYCVATFLLRAPLYGYHTFETFVNLN
jgi:hypothetical protein